MNNCVFLGRLTRDPELNVGQSGTSYCRFSLALDGGKDRDGKEKTNFLDFVAFGAKAEFLNKYFTKGKPMTVVSEATQETWEDGDGNRRSKVSFIARDIGFVPSSGNGGTPAPSEQQETVGAVAGNDDDVPF